MGNSVMKDEIDALVERFFAAFDNRSTEPSLARILDCFSNKAVVARSDNNGTHLFTVEEFAVPRINLLADGSLINFTEIEESSTTQVFGGIATRTSRYRKAGVLHGSSYVGAGTKCFQFVRLGNGWRISSLAWVDDNS